MRSSCASALAASLCLLSACASKDFPQGGPAFRPLAAGVGANQTPPMEEYRIGPLDSLSITVFRVKDLTLEKQQVDASGQILLPLIGKVQAAGKTTTELSADIAAKLSAEYMQNPQVSVMVEESAMQKVTVSGAVTEAGVFQLRGRTTLMQALAMAKGVNHEANLHRVAVFRQINGQRMAAVYDLAAIKAGRAADPEVQGNDVVVVDDSTGKGAWHAVIAVVPSLWALSYLK